MRGLANLALDQEDYSHAFDLHLRLLEMNEKLPEVFYNAGLICQKGGRAEQAASFYQQALEKDPQFASALVNLGHTLMELGHPDEARSCWRRAVQARPELAQNYFESAPAV